VGVEAASHTARVLEQLSAAADLIDSSRIGPPLSASARRAAAAQAQTLVGESAEVAGLGLTVAVAELLATAAVDLAARPPETARLLSRLGEEIGLSPALLGRELVRSGRLLELGTEVAIEVQLALLATLTATPGLSLWTAAPPDGAQRRIALVGEQNEPAAAAARRALDGQSPAASVTARDGLLVRRLRSLRPPPAVLVADPGPRPASLVELLIAAAEPVLTALLERRVGLERETSRDALSGAVARRLARLRFDLHDGPQQDVVLLAQDLRLFRDQLHPLVADDPDRERVMGRLDDLEAQLVALDGDLRRLSTAVQSPFLASGTLGEALTEISLAFAQRTGIEPDTRFVGDLDALTESQQITVLALVREALSNVRKHSDAEHVSITVAADPGGVAVEVSDDGSGFDTESALVRAARTGHLGLVGMHERVRMLGGRTQIVSRPGGPTIISAVLPPVNGGEEPTG
jgi:signal transduction histidine kinase